MPALATEALSRDAVDALPLAAWIERHARLSAAGLASGISATGLVYQRSAFGQRIRPAKGSVLASPTTDPTDAGPDYFFHWLRDGAAVMDAALALMKGPDAAAWIERFEDWVRFTLDLGRISGRAFLSGGDFRRGALPGFARYIRADDELAAIEGDRALDEARYNADGSLDFVKWARPQHDGEALGALVALRFWRRHRSTGDAARGALAELIERGLGYAAARAEAPCYDIWEEEIGDHYYTRLVQWTALEEGAAWIGDRGAAQGGKAERYRAAAARLARGLDGSWCDKRRIYRSRAEPTGAQNPKAFDTSVILAVLHAGRESGPHSVADPRVRSTLAQLEDRFAADYALNRGHARPFAFGRYRGDRYFSGGAWYLASFAAAEFYYRLAAASASSADAEDFCARGDAILAAVRGYVPASGELSEQFDQTTGAQTSAKNLTWSYAAFITAWAARNAAIRRAPAKPA